MPTQITSPRYRLKDAGLGRSQLFCSFMLIDCEAERCETARSSVFYCLYFSFLPVLDCPALTLQSSRSLDALSDLKLQRLEAELEGARHEAQGACQREEELKAECERLKDEMRQLQSSQRVSVCLNVPGEDRRALPEFSFPEGSSESRDKH